ncbi:MAG: ribonuclease P protein component, partial [Gammaproteobacteria bacterium]|nr:ribonuclease P protein component [Gammaproteobacteria bacterium]
ARYRLRKDNRLLDAAAFGRVFEKATRSRDKCFTVLCRSNDREAARLGLAISKKQCKKASARNRLKRLIRESFRHHQQELAGLDIVVMNKAAATEENNAQLLGSLEKHWHNCSTARQE